MDDRERTHLASMLDALDWRLENSFIRPEHKKALLQDTNAIRDFFCIDPNDPEAVGVTALRKASQQVWAVLENPFKTLSEKKAEVRKIYRDSL